MQHRFSITSNSWQVMQMVVQILMIIAIMSKFAAA